MEVPATILEILKCTSCEVYLSRGPVYLQHDEAAVCGRCYTPKRPAIRNKLYESTAKMLKFPCKYREFGCLETVPYVDEEEVIAHEEVCDHRQYVCPVLGSAHCDWLGTRAAILAHCRDEHEDRVLENPCSLAHDIAKASLHNYIIRAFQLLFLLHTKVCVATGKIFHSVRILEESAEAPNFFYILNIKRGNEQISKEGQVAPQGCLAIQEDTSVAVNTNSLLDMLSGFDGTTFTVTVKRRLSDAMIQLAKRMKLTCAVCKAEITGLRYRTESGWRCECCAPGRRTCRKQVQGCSYIDINKKCTKHERYFCQQRTKCHLCDEDISGSTLSVHYLFRHQDITHSSGSAWRVTETEGQFNFLVRSDAGAVVCVFKLDDTGFDLEVFTSVTSERLREFRCEVRVTNPTTGDTQTYTPDAVYDAVYDWCVQVKKREFLSWSGEFDVIIDISNDNAGKVIKKYFDVFAPSRRLS